MIWKTRQPKSEWHDVFIWFPRTFSDGKTRWLEKVRGRNVDVGQMWPEYSWQYCLPGEEW